MTAWDWQWQMAWDPWEEMQRPDWRVRAWRMQRDRARRTKEFEERRRRVALQESAALRRLREVRAERMPAPVKRSTATATGAVGTATPTPSAAPGVDPYTSIGGWYDNRFYRDYGNNERPAGGGLDLGKLFRQTSGGLISVDGRARADATDGLEQMVTSRGEVFWYDPSYFRRDGDDLSHGGASLFINTVATNNVVGIDADGSRILGPIGGPAPLPTTVYAWSPGKGLYGKDVDASVWENGGTVQSLIEQWEAEQAKGATGGTQ